tara:strand:- start:1230 stop:1871 length:642 start_codon:yes stop_codon:yes gene_type:complete
MKFLFCSLSDRPVLSEPMWRHLQEYCCKYNYKCILESKVLDQKRAPSWSKILLLQREMKNNPDVDVLVWVDDDIIITNKNIDFQELIKPYDFSHLLISEDVVWSPFNCGILVVKNNQETYDYFTEIYNLGEQMPEKLFGGLWEQDVMVHHRRYCSSNDKLIRLIPHNIIQSFYRDHDLPEDKKWKKGHFSAHITGMPLDRRIKMRNEVLKIII